MELLAEAISPMYWRLLKPLWDNGELRVMPRPYFYQSFAQGVYAYAIPITCREMPEYHEVAFVVTNELGVEEYLEIIGAYRDALFVDPNGKVTGRSVYVIAHHRRRGTGRLIEAASDRRARTAFIPVIERSPERAVMRALCFFASYLASRLEGYLRRLGEAFNVGSWVYVPNRLYRLLSSEGLSGALYYMNTLNSVIEGLASRLPLILRVTLNSLHACVRWLARVVEELRLKVREEERALLIAELAVKGLEEEARVNLRSAEERVKGVLEAAGRRALKALLAMWVESRRRTLETFINRVVLAKPL
ncbi:MAG: hypothetical protein QXW94_02170 [Desulfurococcaceae archaeon]